MSNETITIPDGFRMDAKGCLIPIHLIKPVDLARDEIVKEIVEKAKEHAKAVAHFKISVLEDIGAFVELSLERYGVKISGKKGNLSMASYCGRYRINRAIADTVEFDEGLLAAKELIDQCLNEWSEGSDPKLKTVVTSAFKTNSNGELATHKILGLRRLDIQDDKWQRAMKAIGDALSVKASKTYVRFYERNEQGDYVQISLDPTEL